MASKKGTIPDITRLVKQHVIAYREGVRMNNTAGMMLALDSLRAWNVLLPTNRLKDTPHMREYGIVESTEHYVEKTRKRQYIPCPNCKKNIEIEQEQFHHRTVTVDEMMQDGNYAHRYALWDKKQMDTWSCPDCATTHDIHDLDGHVVITVESPAKVEPDLLRIMPSPPSQDDYVRSVDGHHQWLYNMRAWTSRMYVELTAETARWRMDKMKSGELVADLSDREYEGEDI